MFPQDKIENWAHGQGLWAHVPAADWNDWRWQLRNRITTAAQLETLMPLTAREREGFRAAEGRLDFAITPHFFNLIDRENPACPIRLQVVPRAEESLVAPGETSDPVGEEKSSPVPGLVHRYPDRVLLLSTDRCACYCRYCTRSRLVSNARGYDFHPQLEAAFRYIAAHEEVRDVLVSGGDFFCFPTTKSTTCSRVCERSRTWNSCASARAFPCFCRNASRPSSAQFCGNAVRFGSACT